MCSSCKATRRNQLSKSLRCVASSHILSIFWRRPDNFRQLPPWPPSAIGPRAAPPATDAYILLSIMSDVDAEEHFLSPYLSRRLPELGLDYETYGPYCLGAVGGSEEEEDSSSHEELDGIIELLQSSSETHTDDAAAWADLRAEIVRRTGEWRRAAGVRKRQEAQTAKEAEEEKLRRAKAEAEAYEEILREKKAQHGETPEEEEEEEEKAQRDALLNRFAYEKEEDGDNEGGPVSNKDAAAQAQREHVEKVREQSSKSRESKAEARQKNKEAVKLKADKKEERRKKAAKGERKR